VVEAEHAAKSITPLDHRASARGRRLGERDDVVQPLVIPLGMKVNGVLGDQAPKVPFAERHNPIEAPWSAVPL
jgi:hypothetical protein